MAKTKERGLLGSGNANGLYIPISETEQEALDRLISADDLEVHVKGWGIIHHPQIHAGDLRVGCHFQLLFNRPDVPTPVYFFDLELRTRGGLKLYAERQPCVYNGQPLQIAAGVVLDMVWDIALRHMDPKVVKALVPHAWGLTSRRQDKDTGVMTNFGNMQFTPEQKAAAHLLQNAEADLKKQDLAKVIDATRRSGGEMKATKDGVSVA